MTITSTSSQAGTPQQAVSSIARWDDDGGAPKFRPDMTSDDIYRVSQSWFVPPIVVPAFFMALILFATLYQRAW